MDVVEFRPTPDQYAWTFGGVPPVATVKPGTLLKLWTEDAFAGRLRTVEDLPSLSLKMPDVNPQTGPFHVAGAEPGDTLAVHFVSIEPARDWAASSTIPFFGGLSSTDRTATLQDPLPERTWMGRTATVPQQVVARGSRNVGEVLCSISNEKMELKPNTTVNIRIQLKERKNVLAVPRAAVEVSGNSRYVYVVDGNRLRRKQIKVGISNDTQFEIADGVNENDAVALPGDAPLKDGLVVQVDSAP